VLEKDKKEINRGLLSVKSKKFIEPHKAINYEIPKRTKAEERTLNKIFKPASADNIDPRCS
jgi:hypothetical protein